MLAQEDAAKGEHVSMAQRNVSSWSDVKYKVAAVLAMPVFWKGTLQQYAGRLQREHAGKTDVKSSTS